MAIEGLETRGDLERFVREAMNRAPEAAIVRQAVGAAAQEQTMDLLGGGIGAAFAGPAALMMTPVLTSNMLNNAQIGAANAAFWLDPAELKGSLKIRWHWHTGSVAPGVGVTLVLYSVTAFSNLTIATNGPAAVSNVIAAPAANAHGTVDSAEFVIPSAGWYAMEAVILSGSVAAQWFVSGLLMRSAS